MITIKANRTLIEDCINSQIRIIERAERAAVTEGIAQEYRNIHKDLLLAKQSIQETPEPAAAVAKK